LNNENISQVKDLLKNHQEFKIDFKSNIPAYSPSWEKVRELISLIKEYYTNPKLKPKFN